MANDLYGDDFSHTQAQDEKAHVTTGEYRVKLPDGRVQIVSYRADKDGYRAEVKYAESKENEADKTKVHPYVITSPQQNAGTLYSPSTGVGIDYRTMSTAYNQLHHQDLLSVEKSGYNIKSADNFDNYPQQGLFVSKQPFYKESLRDPNAELISDDKFQVIPGQKVPDGIHGQQKLGKFIVSPLAVYSLPSLKDFRRGNPLSSATPDAGRYSQLYITVPNFRLVQRQPGDETYGNK